MELVRFIFAFQFGHDVVVEEGLQNGSLTEALFTCDEDRETDGFLDVAILVLKKTLKNKAFLIKMNYLRL